MQAYSVVAIVLALFPALQKMCTHVGPKCMSWEAQNYKCPLPYIASFTALEEFPPMQSLSYTIITII